MFTILHTHTHTQGNCTFEYLPLKVGETTGKLSLQSSDLGVYQYELHLSATPPLPEREFHFTTHLGSSHQQQCSFVSYAKGRTEYTCKVSLNVLSKITLRWTAIKCPGNPKSILYYCTTILSLGSSVEVLHIEVVMEGRRGDRNIKSPGISHPLCAVLYEP